jgi:excisionase family DNA binding protein
LKSEILTTLTPDELAVMVAEKLFAMLKQQPVPRASEVNPGYLTRKEVAAKYHITLSTLNDWTKRGIIKGYRIGRRVLYKMTEIDAGLKVIDTGNA